MMHRYCRYSLSLFLALLLGFSPLAAHAQDSGGDATAPSDDAHLPKDVKAMMKAMQAQARRLADQEKKLSDTEKALSDQRMALEKERLQFEKLQTQMITLTGHAVPIPSESSEKTAAAQQPAQAGNSSAPQEVGTERKEAKDKPPEVAAVIDQGGVLTGKGKIVVTPALEYSRSSATAVEISGFSVIPSLNLGLFDISQVNRDMVTPSLDLRYGVTNRFEIEGKVPYVWRKDSTLGRLIGGGATSDTLTSVSSHDIGDAEFSGHYQINNGQAGWPYLIGNLRFKTATGTSPFDVPIVNGLETELPTGSGFYALQPSITAILPSDPVVYYSNFGYLHSFARSYAGYGRVQPGDAFSGSMGMSLSLNDKSSFSIGYSHTMVLKTEADNLPIANSDVLQVGTVDLGFSYNITDATNVNFTVSAGVTSDAPDVRLIFRVPMTFDLF